MAESTLTDHTTIKSRFEEQERLGADGDELLKWLESEAAVSGGFGTLTSAEMSWTLSKIHNLLG